MHVAFTVERNERKHLHQRYCINTWLIQTRVDDSLLQRVIWCGMVWYGGNFIQTLKTSGVATSLTTTGWEVYRRSESQAKPKQGKMETQFSMISPQSVAAYTKRQQIKKS